MTAYTRETTLEDPQAPETASQESQGRGMDRKRDGRRASSLDSSPWPVRDHRGDSAAPGPWPRNAQRRLARAGLSSPGR
jgi:hypothetical protein